MTAIVKKWSAVKLSKQPILLLGNGASRAIDNDAFNYESLLSRAELSTQSKSVFELVGDSDFADRNLLFGGVAAGVASGVRVQPASHKATPVKRERGDLRLKVVSRWVNFI